MPARYRDYYQTLGVSRDASQDEIQRAYRTLARQHHPDVSKSPDADRRFKEIGEAYEVLKDPDKRARYDALGDNWRAGDDFGAGAARAGTRRGAGGVGGSGAGSPFDPRMRGGFPRTGGGAGGHGGHGFDSDFSDFFESLFGGAARSQPGAADDAFAQASRARTQGQRARRRRGGQDQKSELTISLSDAYHTPVKEIGLETTSADGRTQRRTLSVRIPPGITSGAVIRLAGLGEPGEQGGPAGDLLLSITITPDKHYRIDPENHHDLLTTLMLAPHEGVLGAKVPLRTLDGEIIVAVPPGSGSGQKLRIRGKGLPKKSGDRGDLIAELRIVVPKTLHPDEKLLYEQLANISNFDPRRPYHGSV